MEVTAEDALEILLAFSDEMRRIGLAFLSDDILKRVRDDGLFGEETLDRPSVETQLGLYLNYLVWELRARSSANSGVLIEKLQHLVEHRIEGVEIQMAPDPITGLLPPPVPMNDLLFDYTHLALEIENIMGELGLTKQETPENDPDFLDDPPKK